MANILWLDNDVGYTADLVDDLTSEGHRVTVVKHLHQADTRLTAAAGDLPSLVIVDAMIPVVTDDECAEYASNAAGGGHNSGLEWFKRHKETLKRANIKVILLTIRLDNSIKDSAVRAGLPAQWFMRKAGIIDGRVLANKVESVLATDWPAEEGE